LSVDDYRIYTTKFDAEVDSNDLDRTIGPLTRDQKTAMDEAWQTLEYRLLPWTTNARVTSCEIAAHLRNIMSEDERQDTAVSLLIDHSGSMRGQPILYAAATAGIISEFLRSLGITCEILGFTTSAWRGGRSRERWRWRFSQRNPGRLNDLLHIVYLAADDTSSPALGHKVRPMLRPDLLKENIDGEGIQWASTRLEQLPHNRKLLLVLSDGAPVDDSTLMENGDNYLHDHLRAVIDDIWAKGAVEIAGVGLGYAVDRYYPVAAHCELPMDLAATMLDFLALLLEGESAWLSDPTSVH
jgi:cobaltochelatase CobT